MRKIDSVLTVLASPKVVATIGVIVHRSPAALSLELRRRAQSRLHFTRMHVIVHKQHAAAGALHAGYLG